MADDAAKAAPNVYRVLFENDRVRLLGVRLKADDGSAMHGHPDYLLYALSPGKVALRDPSGASADVEIAREQVMWRPAEEHSVRNIGGTDLEALFFELK